MNYKGLMAIAVLALGGCSAMFDLPAQRSDPSDSPESYYRQLVVASGLPAGLIKAQPSAPVQISALRRSVAPQPGDWMACLRAAVEGRVKYLAVFLKDRAVIASRSDVEIDGCETEQYSPLAMPDAAGRPAAAPPSDRRRPRRMPTGDSVPLPRRRRKCYGAVVRFWPMEGTPWPISSKARRSGW